MPPTPACTMTADGNTAQGRARGGPRSDPYVRRNIGALEAIDIARGMLPGGDKRIYPAVERRNLVWEEHDARLAPDGGG